MGHELSLVPLVSVIAERVSVYNLVGTNWNRESRSFISNLDRDRFGWSVDMSADGNRIVIGVPFKKNLEGSDMGGVVRIIDLATNRQDNYWKVILGQAGAGELFGYDVAMSSDGNRVAIGAVGANANTGFVRIIDFDGPIWFCRCYIGRR
jgi:hypothetical protein